MRFRCIPTVNMVYFECRFVLLSSLYINFQNGTSMVNEGLWIGLYVANPPASHLQSAECTIYYLHLAFDVIPKVDTTSALCEFNRMRREGQLFNSHEAFVNEVAMYSELRRSRPLWGADKHEWLRWLQWARRYCNAPFSAEFGPHNAHRAQGEHTIRSQQALITSASHHHRSPHAQGCLPQAQLMLTICHTHTGCHMRSTVRQPDLSFKRRGCCFGQWPNYMDKYVRTGTSAL